MSLKAMRRLIHSLVILLACTVLAGAQDAGQVLRLSVGFNSLKNTLKAENKLSGDKLAEVERLGEMAKQANASSPLGTAPRRWGRPRMPVAASSARSGSTLVTCAATPRRAPAA